MRPDARIFIRLGPALIFIIHGFLKLFGGFHDQTVALFLTVNIPLPELSAWLIGALELCGGFALLLGVLVRPVAALLAVEMAVAIYRVRLPQGFLGGWEFELLLLLICVGLAVTGDEYLVTRSAQKDPKHQKSTINQHLERVSSGAGSKE